MTVEIQRGARVYHLLAPFVVPAGNGAEERTIDKIVMPACTWAVTRRWLAGEYDHADGMITGLLEAVTGLKMGVLERMQYPDTDLFMAEFMAHIPPNVREMIATGQYPDPALKVGRTAPPPSASAVREEVPGVAEEVHYDPEFAAQPLTDDDAGLTPGVDNGFGMKLDDG